MGNATFMKTVGADVSSSAVILLVSSQEGHPVKILHLQVVFGRSTGDTL